ncbi:MULTISPECIES: DUF1614 domain-containing protein [unclassified Methanoregula]|uniref:DUF1614 domain-containing protein n=1 Tax=unclassified Methanoregula TaxID=2649730 RepID=UPI0009D62B96|nr:MULTISPECIES: DUF1614 domain-containing protein [unclassified Methanoregula]OPX61627.1 MAG: hypothetical protein A4E33_02723 [Methanoregula sp. PtaB.Bin085]OPY34064.1 MAG: hypothetical protein A4E34_01655 [Methanoregula sp. PtaU1.Bin006]
MAGGIRYFSAGPLTALVILLLVVVVICMIPLVFLGIIGTAFTRLGLSWIASLALVLLMLAGSFVNIPLFRICRDMTRAVPLDAEGNELVHSSEGWPVWETVVSINLGGAVIPLIIAAYLIYQAVVANGIPLLVPVALCTVVCMAISFISAREIPGAGIQISVLIPSLTALLAGLFLSGGGTGLAAAVTALAGGTFGVLAGGNLAHLPGVRNLDIPEFSIGGNGSFSAVFLCCILPALIA